MTYDNELTLIDKAYATDEEGNFITDEIGDAIATETTTTILCGIKSISRGEFYSAAQNKLKPELTFVIHSYEYDGQMEIEYDEKRYTVLRTYSTGFEELELTVERAVNGN